MAGYSWRSVAETWMESAETHRDLAHRLYIEAAALDATETDRAGVRRLDRQAAREARLAELDAHLASAAAALHAAPL